MSIDSSQLSCAMGLRVFQERVGALFFLMTAYIEHRQPMQAALVVQNLLLLERMAQKPEGFASVLGQLHQRWSSLAEVRNASC